MEKKFTSKSLQQKVDEAVKKLYCKICDKTAFDLNNEEASNDHANIEISWTKLFNDFSFCGFCS